MIELIPILPAIWATIAEVKDVKWTIHLLGSIASGLVLLIPGIILGFAMVLDLITITIFGVEFTGVTGILLPFVAFIYGFFSYWFVVCLTKIFEKIALGKPIFA